MGLSTRKRRTGVRTGSAPLSQRVMGCGACGFLAGSATGAFAGVAGESRPLAGNPSVSFADSSPYTREPWASSVFWERARRELSRGLRVNPGRTQAIPQSASLTAPFTQGSLGHPVFKKRGAGIWSGGSEKNTSEKSAAQKRLAIPADCQPFWIDGISEPPVQSQCFLPRRAGRGGPSGSLYRAPRDRPDSRKSSLARGALLPAAARPGRRRRAGGGRTGDGRRPRR